MTEQETIFVKVMVPQKPYAVKEAASVVIPAVNGPYRVLPKRAPSIMLLKRGMMILQETETSKPERYFITSGYAKIRDNGCTILTRRIINADEADINEIKKEISVLEKTEHPEEIEGMIAIKDPDGLDADNAEDKLMESSKKNIAEEDKAEEVPNHVAYVNERKIAFLRMVEGYLEKRNLS